VKWGEPRWVGRDCIMLAKCFVFQYSLSYQSRVGSNHGRFSHVSRTPRCHMQESCTHSAALCVTSLDRVLILPHPSAAGILKGLSISAPMLQQAKANGYNGSPRAQQGDESAEIRARRAT
jgi:hypothetical protein